MLAGISETQFRRSPTDLGCQFLMDLILTVVCAGGKELGGFSCWMPELRCACSGLHSASFVYQRGCIAILAIVLPFPPL
jgi:hypothetical protein